MTDVHRCDGCTRLAYGHDGTLRNDAVLVGLSDDERAAAERAADARLSATKRLGDRGGVYDSDPRPRILLGALGEVVVARVLGLAFDEKPFGLDVGRYNVRTRGRFWYELIVQDEDVAQKPTTPFILVTADDEWRVFIVRGWMTPQEARTHQDWRKTHGGYRNAFFVPQADLHDLRRLPERRAALGLDAVTRDVTLSTYDDVPDSVE